MSQALFLGYCKITNSIIPNTFEFYWQPPAAVYDPAKAKKLLAEAGYPNGFDAGPFTVDSSYANMGEAVVDNLQQVGIRSKLRPIERAAFLRGLHRQEIHQGHHPARQAAPSATPRRGSPPSSSRAAPTSMAAIPTSTHSIRSRPTNSTRRSARRSSKRCSSWSTRRRSMRRSGSSLSSTASARGSASSAFGLIPGFPYTAPFEDITIKGA